MIYEKLIIVIFNPMEMQKEIQKNIIPHKGLVSKVDRQKIKGHKSATLWFTGLSGSGKSTLSHALEHKLVQMKVHCYVLDGDNIRRGINHDLGFSPESRVENIRRVGEVSKLFVDAGVFALSAFISPYARDREMVRNLVEPEEFIEIYVKCSVDECEKRDPKGLYKKARAGEIPDFTGISAPYEEPVNPEIIIDTTTLSVDQGIEIIIKYLNDSGYLAL